MSPLRQADVAQGAPAKVELLVVLGPGHAAERVVHGLVRRVLVGVGREQFSDPVDERNPSRQRADGNRKQLGEVRPRVARDTSL